MAKSKIIQKAERESLNIKDKLLETLKASAPEVFAEGRVNWDKLRRALGEHLETSADKFNFMWAGKAQAVTNVLIPSKATLRPDQKESVKFDTSENLFIEGDNLEVLKLLQKSYFEQIKMIYIDPPYNINGDRIYHDDFTRSIDNYLEQTEQIDAKGNRLQTNAESSGRFHSDWLALMYPRLKLAWNLLSDDGLIFISIDDVEVHHLRILMNEIFGEDHFIGVLKRRASRKTAHLSKSMSDMCDYVLIYGKSEIENPLSVENVKDTTRPVFNEGNAISIRTIPLGIKAKCEDGKYKKGQYKARSINFELLDDLVIKNGVTLNEIHVQGPFRINQETLNKTVYITKNVSLRRYLLDAEKDTLKAMNDLVDNPLFYNEKGTEGLEKIFSRKNMFNNPKPVQLIQHFMKATESSLSDTENVIVCDFFAGSATTAHAVLAQNQEDGGKRKFILVQMPEPTDPKSEAYKAGYKTIADIAKERIRRVIKGYGDHKPIDDGFKVFKLDKSNYSDNLFEYDPEKSDEENEKVFRDYLNKAQKELFPAKISEIDIVYENIIKEGLSLNARIDEIKIGKTRVYKVTDGEREILISLDEKIADSDKANLALSVNLKTI